MNDKYSLPLRTIHWLMSILILCIIAFGLWMTNLPNEYPDKFKFYNLHKSFGLTILGLTVIRVMVRASTKAPEFPYEISKFSATIARFTHFFLYLLLIIMPVSGYIMSVLGGHPVIFFGYELPNLFEINKLLAKNFWKIHIYCAYVLIIAIILHIAGFLKHYFIERVNLLRRMW